MHSLLHHSILVVATTLMLALYVTQAQANDGLLTGVQKLDSYARQYLDEKASSVGLSKPNWYPGGMNTYSFARVTYKNQDGFMKCIPGDKEKRAFEALLTALKELTGSYAAYRSNVAYPLTYVKVDADSTRPSGYCFVYRYINGVTLREYMAEEDYATRLIIINQIMPQLLQAFIYLYNAGVNHRDVHTMSIMIEKQDSKGLKVVLIDFDVVGILPDDRRMLDINLTPTNDVTGLRSPYTCDYFHQMPGYFIRELIPQYAVADPLRLTSHEYDKIRKHIRQATSSKITSLKYLIKHKFTTATNAYISLMRVNTISRHSNDCSSFVTTLKSVYPSSLYPTRGMTTNNLHNRL